MTENRKKNWQLTSFKDLVWAFMEQALTHLHFASLGYNPRPINQEKTIDQFINHKNNHLLQPWSRNGRRTNRCIYQWLIHDILYQSSEFFKMGLHLRGHLHCNAFGWLCKSFVTLLQNASSLLCASVVLNPISDKISDIWMTWWCFTTSCSSLAMNCLSI